MTDRRTHGWLRAACFALVLLFISVGGAAQFTADIVDSLRIAEKARTSRLYVKGMLYRMDVDESGKKVIVLVNTKAQITRVLFETEKIYMEMPSDEEQSLYNDPFQAARYIEKVGQRHDIGMDTIEGYTCDVCSVMYDTSHLMNLWVAQELDFPVKMDVWGLYGRTMSLLNIQEMELNDSLFEMPEGYAKAGEPEIAASTPPEWLGNVGSAAFVKPPFEKKMSAGEMVRLVVEPGKGVKVRSKSSTADTSSFTALPFKNGKPAGEPSVHTYNMMEKGGMRTVAFRQTPREANEIVIHVNDGVMEVSASQFDLGRVEVLSAPGKLSVPLEGAHDIVLRVVNMVDSKSICTYTLLKDGVELDEEVIGPLPLRTYRLETDNEDRVLTLGSKMEADELVVEVVKGQVLVNVGQPER